MSADALIRQKLLEIAAPRRTPFTQMRSEPPVPDELKRMTFYHGVGSEAAAQSILRSGMLNQGSKTGKGWQTPLPGRVYLTTKPGLAAGHGVERIPDGGTARDLRRGHGYVFKVDGRHLQHAFPDEDSIGALLSGDQHAGGGTSRRGPQWLHDLAAKHLTPDEVEHVWMGAPSKVEARIGKKLAPHITPEQGHELITHHGAHLAHPGNLPISGAWRIDRAAQHAGGDWKAQRAWRERAGSSLENILHVAEPIHHLIGKGSPDGSK